jgi:hypothetical protein
MRAKYRACADPVLGARRASDLRAEAEALAPGQSAARLLDLATAPLAP